MATVQERRLGAVVGSAVADAAAQPLHWIYDLEKLDNLIEGTEEVEFRVPSANPYYSLQTGSQSCYGDQAFVLLQSLVECQGLDIKDLTERTYKFFGPGSAYDNPVVDSYTLKGELKSTYPVKTPWRHFSLKDFLRNVDDGKVETGSEKDDNIDCVAKIAPLVALYAGDAALLDKAEDVIRVTQNSDFTVAIGLAAARLLEQYILHGPKDNALEKVIRELRHSQRQNPQELDVAMAAHLQKVFDLKATSHRKVTSEILRND